MPVAKNQIFSGGIPHFILVCGSSAPILRVYIFYFAFTYQLTLFQGGQSAKRAFPRFRLYLVLLRVQQSIVSCCVISSVLKWQCVNIPSDSMTVTMPKLSSRRSRYTLERSVHAGVAKLGWKTFSSIESLRYSCKLLESERANLAFISSLWSRWTNSRLPFWFDPRSWS